MWHKFRIRFNSSILTAYFLITAAAFTILLLAIWSISAQEEKIANLNQDENFIINGITGSILGSVELDSQGLQTQSQVLMQESLNYMFENNKNNAQFHNVARVGVYFLISDNKSQTKQLLGEWTSDKHIKKECIQKRTEYFPAPKSQYTYLVDLSLNTCADSNLSLLEFNALSTPILIALTVIVIWGIFIYSMLNSVSFAVSLLGSSDNTTELLEKTESIKWTNVGILAQRALQVRGKNLQYYQTLVLDAQHDISKILDFINSKYNDKELNHNISIVSGIIQRLAAEVRSSDGPYQDITSNRKINLEELIKLIKIYYPGSEIINKLPINFCLLIEDIFLFERLMVNLSSNSTKHSIQIPKVKLLFEDSLFKLRIFTVVSRFSALKLNFAQLTGRIDLNNTENPVYLKLFGRTGRGLSIVKRGVIKLGGKVIFTIKKNIVESGIDLPASLIPINYEKSSQPKIKKRVIIFKNEDFIKSAKDHGLSNFLISEAQLNELLLQEKNLEIVSDYEINVPENSTARLITKIERIDGIALNWLKIL